MGGREEIFRPREEGRSENTIPMGWVGELRGMGERLKERVSERFRGRVELHSEVLRVLKVYTNA